MVVAHKHKMGHAVPRNSVKVKVKVHILDIAPLRSVSPLQTRSGIWHVFSRDFTVLPAHPHLHPQSE